MKRSIACLFVLIGSICGVQSQNGRLSSSEIYHELLKIEETTRVLYLAAHPDDENTRLIAYLSNDRKFSTAYLSLTRGDGGQNLIGDEQGAHLGLIRTHELLAARRIDGGRQYFTRAVDFGYSKSADETLALWEKDSVLADVVWVIRNFRPDVIITRFPPDERAGHGHHTASAMLAVEAFEASANPDSFSDQLAFTDPWEVKAVLWNSSVWWDRSLPEQLDQTTLFRVDAGKFDPLLGTSYGGVAGAARSQHRSQGFGASPYRGQQWEYLKLLAGEMPAEFGLMQVYPKWEEWGLSDVQEMLADVIGRYDFRDPTATVPTLLEILQLMEQKKDLPEVNEKIEDLNELIASALGIWAEPVADREVYVPGDTMRIVHDVLLGVGKEVKLTGIEFDGILDELDSHLEMDIFSNDTMYWPVEDLFNQTPYWLKDSFNFLYHVDDPRMIGMPVHNELPEVQFRFSFMGISFSLKRPVVYKFTDPADGEIYRPVVAMPPVVVEFDEATPLFRPGVEGEVTVRIHALRDIESFNVSLEVPDLWNAVPPGVDQSGLKSGEEMNVVFRVTPSIHEDCDCGLMTPVVELSGKRYSSKVSRIDYPHIPFLQIAEPATKKAVLLDMEIPDRRILYVEGAGDLVDESLEAAGLKVDRVDPAMLSPFELNEYDVVITGVRAFNVSDALLANVGSLNEFASGGGTVIVQYNTVGRSSMDSDSGFGPMPFQLSRNRTTDEKAEPVFLIADHPLLQVPNKINVEDFDGWVQERGLYYAGDSDKAYERPLGFSDPGEKMADGSLLYLKHGEGVFIYTGISFFRQLPAGVPGAYKLFFNLIGQ
jgi:LmbE family N-acetylglucosaminyl deacetylase